MIFTEYNVFEYPTLSPDVSSYIGVVDLCPKNIKIIQKILLIMPIVVSKHKNIWRHDGFYR